MYLYIICIRVARAAGIQTKKLKSSLTAIGTYYFVTDY